MLSSARRLQPVTLLSAVLYGVSAATAGAAGERAGARAGTAATTAAAIADLGPVELVRQTTERLLSAIGREPEIYSAHPERAYRLVEEIASPHVDFERISRRVLGGHWRRATPVQRARLESGIRALLVRSYTVAVTGYTGRSITYLPVRPGNRKDRALVRTRIPQGGGQLLSVDYRLSRKDGRWKIHDVIAGGVSLVLTYRATLAPEAKRVGIDGLIEQLTGERPRPAKGS